MAALWCQQRFVMSGLQRYTSYWIMRTDVSAIPSCNAGCGVELGNLHVVLMQAEADKGSAKQAPADTVERTRLQQYVQYLLQTSSMLTEDKSAVSVVQMLVLNKSAQVKLCRMHRPSPKYRMRSPL